MCVFLSHRCFLGLRARPRPTDTRETWRRRPLRFQQACASLAAPQRASLPAPLAPPWSGLCQHFRTAGEQLLVRLPRRAQACLWATAPRTRHQCPSKGTEVCQPQPRHCRDPADGSDGLSDVLSGKHVSALRMEASGP